MQEKLLGAGKMLEVHLYFSPSSFQNVYLDHLILLMKSSNAMQIRTVSSFGDNHTCSCIREASPILITTFRKKYDF